MQVYALLSHWHGPTSEKFNAGVFLMSGISFHQNCQPNSQCYLPGLNPDSHWLTTSVLSHRSLPAPAGAGLKERMQVHPQSCHFTQTAVEMLPQTWVTLSDYRSPTEDRE